MIFIPLPTPSRSKYLVIFPSDLTLCLFFFFLTHQVQFLLPVHSLMCGLPLECEQHTPGAALLKTTNFSLFARNYQSPLPPQLGVGGISCPPPISRLGFGSAWACMGHVHAVLSTGTLYVQLFSYVLRTFFPCIHLGIFAWSSVSVYFHYWDSLGLEAVLGLLETLCLIFLMYAANFKWLFNV